MGAPVTHFEIFSRNGERLQEFYSRLFDWKIDASNPMKYGMVKKEGNGIGGGISNPGPDGMTHVTIYAEVAVRFDFARTRQSNDRHSRSPFLRARFPFRRSRRCGR